MLVVSRRKGQRIVIGQDIEVVVSGVSGSTVRLAIVAPRSVPVLRGEVFDAVAAQNQAALEAGEELDVFLSAEAPQSTTQSVMDSTSTSASDSTRDKDHEPDKSDI
ncbi:MAG: carbon storage regulator [Polyangiaceae bacterium]|nr:carbon storage regulator [Polyangiaceae bacterium]